MVLVVVDATDGSVPKPTLELLTLARRIGEPAAVVFGPQAGGAVEALGAHRGRENLGAIAARFLRMRQRDLGLLENIAALAVRFRIEKRDADRHGERDFPVAEADRRVHVVLGARAELPVLLEGLVARLARHDDERDVLKRRILLHLVAHR